MPARTALLLVLMTASAAAAPFDTQKQDLSECLRFELAGTGPRRGASTTAGAGNALRKCSEQIDRLERADPRRLRSDRGLSPSTWSVIEGVFGRGDRGRFAGLLF